VPIDEVIDLLLVFPVTDTCADDDLVEIIEPCRRTLIDGQDNDLVPLPSDYLLQALADFQGMSIGGRIENQNSGHAASPCLLS
jgi:hypothetical protein